MTLSDDLRVEVSQRIRDDFGNGRDYYRLQAFFGGTVYRDVDFATAAQKEAHKKQTDAVTAKDSACCAPRRSACPRLLSPPRRGL